MSDKSEKHICANCKFKLRGWRCMKNYEYSYITGIKQFGTCADKRFCDHCEHFESRKAGGDKTSDQLTIADNVSYTVSVVSTALVILGLLGMLALAFVFGGR